MAKYNLNRLVFNKEEYEKIIDVSFSQLPPPPPPVENTITVEEFFELYRKIFYDIPAEGEINSHTYLIKTSEEYVGTETINEDVQALLDEITLLRQELLEANQQVVSLQATTPST
jgi:hypothetical protein